MSQTQPDQVLSAILPWIQSHSKNPDVQVSAGTDLISENLLDSVDYLQLVTFIEESFSLTMDPDLLTPDNFANPGKIAEVVAGLSGS